MSGNSGCPFFLWGLLACLGLALVISLLFNISHYVEKKKQGNMYRYSDDYIPSRVDEDYIEDTPIYGNLDHIIPEPMDENCYEQMKARPEQSTNAMQDATVSTQAPAETQMFYASLDHSFKGKRRKPRKQNTPLLDTDGDESRPVDTSVSEATLVNSFLPESQEIEENIHDDPVRLFGLIRAKKEPLK